MKQVFRKILAISMAFVVLFSTMSFTFSEHYCGDLLVNSALFSKAESCGMEMQNPSPNKDCSIKKDNCCNDELVKVNGQNQLKIDFTNLTFQQQVFVSSIVYSYINLFEVTTSKKVILSDYSPPLVHKKIAILYQVFRI